MEERRLRVFWFDLLRGFNAVLCLVALWYLAQKAFNQWSGWNVKTQTHWWAFFGWVFIGFEGSLESIIVHARPGPRVVIASIVMVWTIITLLIRGEVRFHSENFRHAKKED